MTKPTLSASACFASILALAACTLSPASAQQPLPAKMQEHVADGFRIVAADDENLVFACSITADSVRRAVHTVMQAMEIPVVAPPQPLSIVLFPDANSMAAELRRVGLRAFPVNAFYDHQTNTAYLGPLRDPATECGPTQATAEYAKCVTLLTDSDLLTRRHELSHLFVYNHGVLTRTAQYPAWIAEGLACLFEVDPQAIHRSPARDIPANSFRLADVGNPDSMLRIRDLTTYLRPWESRPESAARHYAQSWSLVHFLYHRQRKDLGTYLKALSQRKPGDARTPDQELAEFVAAFGPPDETLEKKWRDYVAELIAQAQQPVPRP